MRSLILSLLCPSLMIVGDLVSEANDFVISTAQNPPQWAGKLVGVDGFRRSFLLGFGDHLMTKLVPPKASSWKPKSKQTTPRIIPTRNANLCDTKAQARALKAANKLLAKNGFFKEALVGEETYRVDADACGTHGLRPTWHGKA